MTSPSRSPSGPLDRVFDTEHYRGSPWVSLAWGAMVAAAVAVVVRLGLTGAVGPGALSLLAAGSIVGVLVVTDHATAVLRLTTDGVRVQTLLRTHSIAWGRCAEAWVPRSRRNPFGIDGESWTRIWVTVIGAGIGMALVGPNTRGVWNGMSAYWALYLGGYLGTDVAFRLAGRRHGPSAGQQRGLIVYDDKGQEVLWFPTRLPKRDAARLAQRLETVGLRLLDRPPALRPGNAPWLDAVLESERQTAGEPDGDGDTA